MPGHFYLFTLLSRAEIILACIQLEPPSCHPNVMHRPRSLSRSALPCPCQIASNRSYINCPAILEVHVHALLHNTPKEHLVDRPPACFLCMLHLRQDIVDTLPINKRHRMPSHASRSLPIYLPQPASVQIRRDEIHQVECTDGRIGFSRHNGICNRVVLVYGRLTGKVSAGEGAGSLA